LATRLISETQRVRYLLGLCSPAERENIEWDYFENDDSFKAMLTAEDDLIDGYARGELTSEVRRRFENHFLSSLYGRKRVQFARAFAGAVSARPVEAKHRGTWFGSLKSLQSPGLLRTATVTAVIVFVTVFAWLVIDRRRMKNEFRELRAEFSELSKRTVASQPRSATERTGTDITAIPPESPSQPHKPRHPERATTAIHPKTNSNGGSTVRGTAKDPNGNLVSGATVTITDSARYFTRTQSTNKDGAYVFNAIPPGTYSIEVSASGFKTALASGLAVLVDTPTVWDLHLELGAVSERVNIASAAKDAVNTSDAILGNNFEEQKITQLPLNARNVTNLLSLQPATTSDGYVAGRRADQANIALDGVDVVEPLNTPFLKPRNTSSGETSIRISSFLKWIRFQIALETAAIHYDYRLTIKTVDGRPVTSVDWIEPLTPNQTIIDTPAIATVDLPSGDYVLLLMEKKPDGSTVKVAEYSFEVIRY
jgi:protocatechuate 3,4-dioxygenase beta subunit